MALSAQHDYLIELGQQFTQMHPNWRLIVWEPNGTKMALEDYAQQMKVDEKQVTGAVMSLEFTWWGAEKGTEIAVSYYDDAYAEHEMTLYVIMRPITDETWKEV